LRQNEMTEGSSRVPPAGWCFRLSVGAAPRSGSAPGRPAG